MKVIFAREMGFCYGVRRAVDTALKSADEPIRTMTLGPIIHNPQVVEYLRVRGVGVVESLNDANIEKIIIRSHGVGPRIYEIAQEKGIEVLDATCPHVRKVREAVLEFAEEGRRIVIIGEADHPEVQGVKEWAGSRAIVVSTQAEANSIAVGDDIGVVAQTTFQTSIFDTLVSIIQKKADNVVIRSTICAATEQRQQAVRELCGKVDLIVVVGGKNSGNTKRLAEIAKTEGKKVILVEVASELVEEDFVGIETVGITAGASTPDDIIQAVALRLRNFDAGKKEEDQQMENLDKNENQVELESSEMTETAEVEKEVTMADVLNEENLGPRLRTGDRVTGTVDTVTSDGIYLHIGGKSDGFISFKEVLMPEDKSLEEAFPKGAEVEAIVLQVQNEDGNAVLSQAKIARELVWGSIQEAFDEGKPLEGKVSEVVKGGMSVFINGVRAFVPASLVDIRHVEDLNVFVGQTLEFVPIELDTNRGRLVVSRRVLLQKDADEKKAVALAKLEVDQVVRGEVKRLTNFGAFVDLGGVDGLIHLSRLSWGHVRRASDIVKEGEYVEVKIVELDKENAKVSLSLKDMSPDPWITTVKSMKTGDVVTGTLARTAKKIGAFIELAPGVDALLPLGEISEDKSAETILESMEIGKEIEAKIIRIDLAQKRLTISLRRLEQEREKAEYQPFLGDAGEKFEVSLGDQLAEVLEKVKTEE